VTEYCEGRSPMKKVDFPERESIAINRTAAFGYMNIGKSLDQGQSIASIEQCAFMELVQFVAHGLTQCCPVLSVSLQSF
jgi:hypothetical protein